LKKKRGELPQQENLSQTYEVGIDRGVFSGCAAQLCKETWERDVYSGKNLRELMSPCLGMCGAVLRS